MVAVLPAQPAANQNASRSQVATTPPAAAGVAHVSRADRTGRPAIGRVRSARRPSPKVGSIRIAIANAVLPNRSTRENGRARSMSGRKTMHGHREQDGDAGQGMQQADAHGKSHEADVLNVVDERLQGEHHARAVPGQLAASS